MLLIMAGLPGTGKSTIARELAQRTGAVVLDKDPIRAALFGPDLVEYSTEQDDFVMQVMLETAGYLFRKNRDSMVILDGRPFSRTYQLERAIEAAEAFGQRWLILECVCSDDLARERLSQPDPKHPAGNRDFALYQQVKQRFEPIARRKVVLDTEQPVFNTISEALQAVTSM